MTCPLSEIESLTEFKRMLLAAQTQSVNAVFGIDQQKPYLSILLQEKLKKKAFIVVPDERAAYAIIRIYEELEMPVLYFPAHEYIFRNTDASSRFVSDQRVSTLAHIANRDFTTVVLTAEAFSTPTQPPEERNDCFLSVGDIRNLSDVKHDLIQLGYTSFTQIDAHGQFSCRGDILDVFPTDSDRPYRIEFYDDSIDTISFFDPTTQRRQEPINKICIPQAKEIVSETINRLKSLSDHLQNSIAGREDLELINAGIVPQHDRYFPAYFKRISTISDYILPEDLLFLFQPNKVRELIDGAHQRIYQDISLLLEEGLPFANGKFILTSDELFSKIDSVFLMESLPSTLHGFSLSNLFQFELYDAPAINPNSVIDTVNEFLNNGYKVYVCAVSESFRTELQQQIKHKQLTVTTSPLPFGFELTNEKIIVFSLRKKVDKKFKRATKFKKGIQISSFSDIHIGDYVVHENYGIGQYEGVQQITTSDKTKDFLKIRFAGTDVLYVPCDSLNLISKYIGATSDKIKLNRLGGDSWNKTKQRTRNAVRDLADKLTKLYAERMQAEGICYSPDTEWQKSFDDSFIHTETDDQITAINEIKKDMERNVPMDRLLCGDVGFGKTEVAMRAAFKAIMDGKQVALLAPTTLLANQHFRTAKERFCNFPIEIELLSRTRTPQQQSAILKRLKSGKIDFLIGTHRILQDDVLFKDLGFIIIDEEQRFGVDDKEKLKQKSIRADILSLSATPIPRTLNMSLNGLRDISVINEPPQNRFPVTSYVVEYSDSLISDAIRRELARGGQCYYLYNDIDTIYKKAQHLEDLTNSNVGIAHGKMSQEQLNTVWQQLLDGEIDVLVCTTIIETGVDVPNCNTLIIENADRLGLSQLHQIRGRVGRSDQRAYAYFTYKKGKTLTEDAYKRLMTIREFTEFGSGMQIAMRDLEIRGAGDLLGAEQSGHMVTVGFDMYTKLLSEAVQNHENSMTEPRENESCKIEILCDAYLPDSFIDDADLRIKIYKLIACANCDDEYSEVVDEITDRFGNLPPPVENLLKITQLRYRATDLKIRKISESPLGFLYYVDAVEPRQISALASVYGKNFLFSATNKPYITIKCKKELKDVDQFLSNYKKCLNNTTN